MTEKAKIIDKAHSVSKVVTEFSVNGKARKRTQFIVTKKDRRTHSNKMYDGIVFDAINKVGHMWYDVYNHIDVHHSALDTDLKLQSAIDKHTIFNVI